MSHSTGSPSSISIMLTSQAITAMPTIPNTITTSVLIDAPPTGEVRGWAFCEGAHSGGQVHRTKRYVTCVGETGETSRTESHRSVVLFVRRNADP